MKLYRGISKKVCESYKKKGIPKNSNFTNKLSGARNKGNCIIIIKRTKNFKPIKESNRTFNQLKISERYYNNINPIKRFKVREFK